mgnify:FL=1
MARLDSNQRRMLYPGILALNHEGALDLPAELLTTQMLIIPQVQLVFVMQVYGTSAKPLMQFKGMFAWNTPQIRTYQHNASSN